MHNVHLVLDFNNRGKRVRDIVKTAKDNPLAWAMTVDNVQLERNNGIIYAKLPIAFKKMPSEYRAFPWIRYEMWFSTAHLVQPGRYSDNYDTEAMVIFNANSIEPYEVQIVGESFEAVRNMYQIIMSRNAAPNITFAPVGQPDEPHDLTDDEEIDPGTLD